MRTPDTRLRLLLLAAALLTPAVRAAAAPPAAADGGSARPAIQAAYDGLNAAFTQHDLPRFMTYFTPDYTVVDEKGQKFDREQTRRQYQQQLGQIQTMQSRYVVGPLTPAPGGTLVEMKMHSWGMGEKRILFAKFHAAFTDDLWVRDLWVHTPQGWQIKSRQTLGDDMKIHPR